MSLLERAIIHPGQCRALRAVDRLKLISPAYVILLPVVGITDAEFDAAVNKGTKPVRLSEDGSTIQVSEKYFAKVEDEMALFAMGNMALRLCQQADARRGDRDPVRWDRAVDFVINYKLVRDRVGHLPMEYLFARKVLDKTFEEVYNDDSFFTPILRRDQVFDRITELVERRFADVYWLGGIQQNLVFDIAAHTTTVRVLRDDE